MNNETFLQTLEDTAKKLSIRVSYEDLRKGEVNTHGGMLSLRGEKRILIHKGLSTDEKIDVLTEILASLDTEGVHMTPEARDRLAAVKKPA